ncbi:6-phosphofructokinase isozyme 2 [Corynebacterium atrinae]|uniref:1-phosphofructokinase family hexose kinase n=1 Tax=Corynebacterium atrinae TaxID=1336740 RepID=UPI0025B4FC2A|nr:1-phosphofructokinase family hexose kinase [Corynebacterium atrinae]WJY63604.1 6-phosphofructokinase isozyme 2 [Corynebacterium atrinae]
MIVTLTPNPSIDATMELDSPLQRGQVIRPVSISQVAGGKGINVSHALVLAGVESTALFPADEGDPFLTLVAKTGIPYRHVPVTESVRINTTLTENDGTTTKINGAGATLDSQARQQVEEFLISLLGANATYLVLAGSLPPGVPLDWYTSLLALVRSKFPDLPIAVDTSDEAIASLGRNLNIAAPTLIKPNGLEIGQMVGADGDAIESAAAEGNFVPAIRAGRQVVDRGVAEVLVTLGPAGAVLVTEAGAWVATPPPTNVVSTVGAGDSSLAGYLIARSQGDSPAECLRRAVAYGSAAASLAGTTIPSPSQLNMAGTTVHDLSHEI